MSSLEKSIEQVIIAAGTAVEFANIFAVRADQLRPNISVEEMEAMFPQLIYAFTGEVSESIYSGPAVMSHQVRVEVHACTYAELYAFDRAFMNELVKSGRLVSRNSLFDDHGAGNTTQTDRTTTVSLAMTQAILRRIRVLGMR